MITKKLIIWYLVLW